MPIGVTASGEVVFPFLCKDFLEQFRTSGPKPAEGQEAGQKAADQEKEAAPVSESLKKADTDAKSEITGSAGFQPSVKPDEDVLLRKRSARPLRGHRGPIGCMYYRTYDAASRTYRDYQGRRRDCIA